MTNLAEKWRENYHIFSSSVLTVLSNPGNAFNRTGLDFRHVGGENELHQPSHSSTLVDQMETFAVTQTVSNNL